jgi:hypothetical protein
MDINRSGPWGASLLGALPLPLALTPLVEPHAHLDKAFSFNLFPNREGTMAGALEANGREAAERTFEQVRIRGERALDQAWRNGVRAIRSHIDSVGPQSAPSWQALRGLRQEWADRVELQLVALVPISHWLKPEGEALAREVAAAGGLLGGVLGAPFAADASDVQALEAVLRLARQHGCGVDLHIDESDRHPGRGLRLLAPLIKGWPRELSLTCSHASSMGLMTQRPMSILAETLAEADVRVVALPTTNLWLLDRNRGRTPWRRPQAPIRQLQAAGVTVAIGGDNVQDPWLPGGDFDPLALMGFSPALEPSVSLATPRPEPLHHSGCPLDGTGLGRGSAGGFPRRSGGHGSLQLVGAAGPAASATGHEGGVWCPSPRAEAASSLLESLGDLSPGLVSHPTLPSPPPSVPQMTHGSAPPRFRPHGV